jgi:hypothetical protein
MKPGADADESNARIRSDKSRGHPAEGNPVLTQVTKLLSSPYKKMKALFILMK